MMQIITDIKLIDRKAWSSFVSQHPDGNIFQTPEMYDVYCDTKNYTPIIVVCHDENQNICGVMMAVIQKEFSGLGGLFTARSIIFGGPIIDKRKHDVLNELLCHYNRIIHRKVIYTQFRNIWHWSDGEKKVFILNGFNWEEHLDITHKLKTDKEELFIKIHAGRKKNIRRAEKYGLIFNEVSTEEDFLDCLQLIDSTYKRIKLPMPRKDFFINSYANLKDKGLLKTFSASYNNKVIGTRLVLCYNGLIYDWYAGSDDFYLDKFTNDFLPWKILEWGCLNNFHTFDFGGAGKPNVPYGVRDYKLKFGGELVNFGRFKRNHLPLLMKIGEVGLKIYKKIK